MSVETRRQEQDVQVYRCDLVRPEGQCVRETASFHTEGDVTVLMDPAWLVLRVGLGEEKQFCCWAHFATWITYEIMGEEQRHAGNDVESQAGEFALRMNRMAREREEREEIGAQQTRALTEQRNRTTEMLETL